MSSDQVIQIFTNDSLEMRSFNGEFSVNAVTLELVSDVWTEAGKKGKLQLTIRSPHDTSYANMYESWYWLAIIRVATPAIAVFISVVALAATIDPNKRRERKEFEIAVCFLEGSAVAVLGVALALGLFGPMSVPQDFMLPFMLL